MNSANNVATFSEKFEIKGIEGVTNLSATTKSVDAKLLKQIERQKELLKNSARYSVFGGEGGKQELSHIASVTKTMRTFWSDLSLRLENAANDVPRRSIFTQAGCVHLDNASAVSHVELEAIQVSSPQLSETETEQFQKLKLFWKTLEENKREKNEVSGSAKNDLQPVSISADVGLEIENPGTCSRSSKSTDAFQKNVPIPRGFTSLTSPRRSQLWCVLPPFTNLGGDVCCSLVLSVDVILYTCVCLYAHIQVW